MKLKNYGRNQKKRKEYIHPSRLLLAGVDVRARQKISSQNWRSDLGWIWPIQLSKAAGIASYFKADFIKIRCARPCAMRQPDWSAVFFVGTEKSASLSQCVRFGPVNEDLLKIW